MKYTITKNDGTPVDPKARYFVLRLDEHGKSRETAAARAAVAHYIGMIHGVDAAASAAASQALDGETEPVGLPTVERVLEKEIKSAEYSRGNPLPVEGWRDVALGMRDWARKLDDMRKGAANWNALLLEEGRKINSALRELVAAEEQHVDEGDAMSAQRLRDAIDAAKRALSS